MGPGSNRRPRRRRTVDSRRGDGSGASLITSMMCGLNAVRRVGGDLGTRVRATATLRRGVGLACHGYGAAGVGLVVPRLRCGGELDLRATATVRWGIGLACHGYGAARRRTRRATATARRGVGLVVPRLPATPSVRQGEGPCATDYAEHLRRGRAPTTNDARANEQTTMRTINERAE